MIFSRERYLKKLIDKKNNGMVKIITGIRRCGKSYLLTELFHPKKVDLSSIISISTVTHVRENDCRYQ